MQEVSRPRIKFRDVYIGSRTRNSLQLWDRAVPETDKMTFATSNMLNIGNTICWQTNPVIGWLLRTRSAGFEIDSCPMEEQLRLICGGDLASRGQFCRELRAWNKNRAYTKYSPKGRWNKNNRCSCEHTKSLRQTRALIANQSSLLLVTENEVIHNKTGSRRNPDVTGCLTACQLHYRALNIAKAARPFQKASSVSNFWITPCQFSDKLPEYTWTTGL
jgi:hypothetical protein